MKKKHSKYRKIWLLWVALEGLVATFAIMNSFLLLRYLYLSHGGEHRSGSADRRLRYGGAVGKIEITQQQK